ncbi:unnamed protein product [Chrysoparadoxa australica]
MGSLSNLKLQKIAKAGEEVDRALKVDMACVNQVEAAAALYGRRQRSHSSPGMGALAQEEALQRCLAIKHSLKEKLLDYDKLQGIGGLGSPETEEPELDLASLMAQSRIAGLECSR